MITKPRASKWSDGFVAAWGVLTLLVGTAFGNAIVMAIMAIMAMAVIVLIYRQRITVHARLAMVIAFVLAAAVAIAIVDP
jgi:hypothetical protein